MEDYNKILAELSKKFVIIHKDTWKDKVLGEGFKIDFIKENVAREIRSQGSPIGWYASAIACVRRDDEFVCEATLNNVLPEKEGKDFVEFYVPKACGKDENFCRVHVDFDFGTEKGERIGRVGITIKTIKLDELKEFINSFL